MKWVRINEIWYNGALVRDGAGVAAAIAGVTYL
jgi:hypothetical protein